MALPLLVIEHETSCPPGWMGDWWSEGGVPMDIRRPYAAAGADHYGLPADLSEHAGLVVLGGEMGANDDADAPWLPTIKELIRAAVASDVPTLGICLGHQLMAVALGGRVTVNPHGHATGLTQVMLTEAGATDPLLAPAEGGGDRLAVQWNNDVVTDLPLGATSLATAPDGTVQAARFGSHAWGVQFHPEAGPDIFDAWTVQKPSADIPRGDGIDIHAAAREIRSAATQLAAVWRPLADRFARQLT